jgi:nucleosome binding factor SPN SPT16 subunit
MSIEFRDGALPLSSKCAYDFRADTAFCLVIGFDKLKGADGGKPYALMIGDTVLVRDGDAEVLTPMPKAWDEINFTFRDDDDDNEEEEKMKDEKLQKLLASQAGGRQQRRGDADGEGKKKTLVELTKYADEEAKTRLLKHSDEVGFGVSCPLIVPACTALSCRIPFPIHRFGVRLSA